MLCFLGVHALPIHAHRITGLWLYRYYLDMNKAMVTDGHRLNSDSMWILFGEWQY